MTEHHPLPWSVDGAGRQAMIRAADLRIVALRHQATADEHQANAAFIVRAVNAHDELVKALTWAMEQIPGYTKRIPKQNEDWCDAYDAAKAALAKAAS